MATLLKTDRHGTPPTLAEIEALADEAFQSLPEQLKLFAREVVLHVDDFPDEETLAEMECESPFDLMGLYRGVALNEKSHFAPTQDVDHIYLYRRPLLDYWCESGEDLSWLVRHVMIHEIGHHFGFSDDDMETLEEQVKGA